MSGDSFDELLREAEEALRERQEHEPNVGIGDDMSPGAGEHLRARWRGDGEMATKERGVIPVYLVWDVDGRPGFVYQHSQLVQEVEAERPQVGDEVVIVRGEDRHFTTKGGEERTVFPYVLKRRECADPLPGATAELPEAASDEDIPF
jgi:hypothetical protein